MHTSINDSENKEWSRTTVHDWNGNEENLEATGTGRVIRLALGHLTHTLTAPVRRVYVHLGLQRAEVDAWYKGRQGWYEVTWEDLYPDPRGYPPGTLETVSELRAMALAAVRDGVLPPEAAEWTEAELLAMAVNPEIESEDL